MCLRCAMKQASTQRHEMLDWTRAQFRNVPDEHLIQVARVFRDALPAPVLLVDIEINSREDAILLLAGFLFPFRKSAEQINRAFEKAFAAGELRGHAA